MQIITGLFLSMFYVPNVDLAFDSVERIMRDIENGWLFRYMHSNGASFFFILLYLHMLRGIYIKSYSVSIFKLFV
jgi:quinol-cytochrome oxidoreductase complex cytochrome b subunit